MKRCVWVSSDPLYIKYHDEEWGVPVFDDQKLFEFLVLESAQAGLSWITVLRKRENYRKAFHHFDPVKVSKMTAKDVEKLLQNEGIIRNRAKIEAAINNAKVFLQIQNEFGSFAKYSWQFVNNKPLQNKWKRSQSLPATSELSDRFSKDLKLRGFKFLGSTVIYAHMQAVGMINDHITDCFRHREVKKNQTPNNA